MEFLFYANYKNICTILVGCINTTKPTDSSFYMTSKKIFFCESRIYSSMLSSIPNHSERSYNISLDIAYFSNLSSTSFIFISIYSSTTSILLNVYLCFLNSLCNQLDIRYCALCKLDCL